MATTTTPARNRTYTAAKAIALGLFGLGLGLSVSHIYGLFVLLGASAVTAAAMPFFIDGVALLGRLARSDKFAAKTRSTGLKVQVVAGTLSLIANVWAGETTGDKLGGVVAVVGYVFAEWFAEQLKPAEAELAQVKAPTRSAAAAKAAATRKANADAKRVAEAARKEATRSRRERKALEAKVADHETVPVTRYI